MNVIGRIFFGGKKSFRGSWPFQATVKISSPLNCLQALHTNDIRLFSVRSICVYQPTTTVSTLIIVVPFLSLALLSVFSSSILPLYGLHSASGHWFSVVHLSQIGQQTHVPSQIRLDACWSILLAGDLAHYNCEQSYSQTDLEDIRVISSTGRPTLFLPQP